jgi:hypothetical protein
MDWGRSRSGCFFCFYQQKIEWVRLKETYPDLFDEAKKYEEDSLKNGVEFTWCQNESLAELEKPARTAEIRDNWQKTQDRKKKLRINLPLVQTLGGMEVDDDDHLDGCLICSL